jgi:hypothetical protein
MSSFVRRVLTLAACCGLALTLSGAALAQSYSLTYLTSNLTGKAKNMDPLLQNAWGLVYAPGGPFWVSDEADGWSTLYTGTGAPQSLQVIVPPISGTGIAGKSAYSALNACIGSTRDARHAGTIHANAATASSVAATAA